MTRKFILSLAFSFQCLLLFSQHQGEQKSLRTILLELEQRYEVTFSYADENIDGVYVVPPAEEITLPEAIDYLEQNTNLNFQQLSERFISISIPTPHLRRICGYLRDRTTALPVIGATLFTQKKAGVSDKLGYFELENVAETDTLLIRFLGYETLRLPVRDFKNESCNDVYLQQKVIKLREVIVANFITKGIDVSSDGSTSINAETLGILPGLTDPDVLQTIQALPGIQSINETVSDINVRGGTNDQNLIYWDGIKMYQSGHFFGLISAFNPYLIKEVVLIKNGTTTALSDGVSSTIDIRTDDKVSPAFSGGAGINMINADLFLKIPLAKKVSLQLSGRRSISDLLETPTYKQYFNRIFRNTDVTSSSDPVADTLVGSDQNFNFYDFTGKLIYNISPNDKLNLSFLKIYNTINYEETALVSNEPESKTSGLEQQSTAASVNYSRRWSDDLLTTAQLYYSFYKLGAVNFDVLNDQRLIQENEILDTGLKLDARLALSNTLDLYTGYQFFEVGVSNLADINNPVYRRLIKRVLRSHAVFAEGNLSSHTGATNLRIGVRGNYFEKFNRVILEPRLAFNQKFLNNFFFEVLGEMKSQSTTQVIDLQNDFLGVEKRRWILANEEDIPIVESKQVSAGIRYQRGNILIGVDGYVKKVDGITSSSQGFQNQFQYIRTAGSYTVKGVDFLINHQIGKFTSWLSYSYGDNAYEFPEFTPSVFPNNLNITHTATFGSSFQTSNFQLSAGINWRTGKPYTLASGVVDGDIIYEAPNSAKLSDYLRVDLSAKYMFDISRGVKGEFGASLWNIMNKQNIVNIFFQIDKNDNLETTKQYALGFTPNFTFRISF